jgi:hypothetical protein
MSDQGDKTPLRSLSSAPSVVSTPAIQGLRLHYAVSCVFKLCKEIESLQQG